MSKTPRVRMRRRSDRSEGGFGSRTATETREAQDAVGLAETGRVEEIVEKYAGSSVPLDEAFPEPPGPTPPHAALTGATRLPEANAAYNRPNPADVEALAAQGAYRREHELKLLHKMLLRDATMTQIANALDRNLSYVLALRHELERRHAAEAANLDVMAHSGSTVRFYREVRALSLRRADEPNIAHRDRARYLTSAISAENSMHRFLQLTGFYDNAPMRPQAEPNDPAADEMETLAQAFKAMLNPDAFLDEMGDLIEGEAVDTPDDSQGPDHLIRTL